MTAAHSTPVTRALDALGLPYRLFTHPGPVKSLAQAAAERGQEPEQVVRSLVFRLGEGRHIMVLAAGGEQISWKALRSYLGESRLTTADEDELAAVTGYQRGAVSPLGLPQPMRMLVDERIWQQDEISLGSGRRGTTVIIAAADLKRALPAAETVQLV